MGWGGRLCMYCTFVAHNAAILGGLFMEWASFLFKSSFIFLGIITILTGRYLPLKIFMSKRMKYKVIDEKNYVKAGRMIFYYMGLYYVVYGIVLLFINGWPFLIGIFGTIIPALIVVASSPNWRRFTEPIK
jgi:hypothetical protein